MTILPGPVESVRAASEPAARWRRQLREAIRDPLELCRRLELPAWCAEPARRAAELFGVFAPLPYLARIPPGLPHDPLLRQVLPLAEELAPVEGFVADPLAERQALRAPGLLQKYRGRALLVVTGACAIHCRYCFRRHFPYAEETSAGWQKALNALAADADLEEIILSGGDPWTLPDQRLKELVARLDDIPHLKRLRIHTRLPIVIPARVTRELLDCLSQTRLQTIVVVHANHPRELDADVAAALRQLAAVGAMLLNQAVLLRGVNDEATTQIALSKRLLEIGVLPYYLHQLDRVAGAAHFDTPPELGPQLVAAMRAQLPGYAVPRLVREDPGRPGKTVLA